MWEPWGLWDFNCFSFIAPGGWSHSFSILFWFAKSTHTFFYFGYSEPAGFTSTFEAGVRNTFRCPVRCFIIPPMNFSITFWILRHFRTNLFVVLRSRNVFVSQSFPRWSYSVEFAIFFKVTLKNLLVLSLFLQPENLLLNDETAQSN